MRGRARWALLVGVLTLAVGCSDGDGSDAGSAASTQPPPSSVVSEATVGGDEAASATSTSSTVPPVSLPPVTPEAAAAAGELALTFGWGDAVVACVAGRFDADPALLGAASAGLSQGTPEFDAVAAAGGSCEQALVWAPRFAEAAVGAAGDELSDEQVTCLVQAWTQLDPQQVDALVQGGLVPGAADDEAADAAAVVSEECGL